MDDGERDWNPAAAPVPEPIPSFRPVVRQHIKKRALRNKTLSIEFNDKSLIDYVSGFHKRKKKRRKEAQKQLQEKERRKRIEARKQRMLEKEYALYGGVRPPKDSSDAGFGADGDGSDIKEDNLDKTSSVSGTKTYDNGDMTITVTTREIPREDEDLKVAHSFHGSRIETGTKPSLQAKKKPLKRAAAKGSHKKHKKHGFQKGNKKKN